MSSVARQRGGAPGTPTGALIRLLVGALAIASCSASPGASRIADSPVGRPTANLDPASTTPSPSVAPTASAPRTPSPLPPGAEKVPGTHVALVPPEGFSTAHVWTGFAHRGGSASIVVAELPGGFDETAPPPDDPRYAEQGLTIETREELTIDGFEALLLEGEQETSGPTFGKLILVIGTDDVTALLTASYPLPDTGIRDGVRAAFLDVVFEPDQPAAPTEALTFTITPAPPLRLATTLMGSTAYNESGAFPSRDKLEMTLIVAPSFGTPIPGDAEAFARQRHVTTPGFTDIDVDETGVIEVDGSDAIELIGTGSARDDGTDSLIYTVLLDEGTRYVLFSGWCREAVRSECLATMRATISTYEPTP